MMSVLYTKHLAAGSLVWLVIVCLPLLVASALLNRRTQEAALRLSPWSGVPALILAVAGSFSTGDVIPWLLLGSRFGLDSPGRIFLLFTSLLWIIAGVYARSYVKEPEKLPRFFLFYLTAMTGNFGLIVAQDMVSFYLFFALMSFASYGLVVFDKTADALRAGRIYIILVVIGEVLLVTALFFIASAADSYNLNQITASVATAPQRSLIIFLILTGFGIKAGALPLHVWLPLAHPVAPTPASAVLSGAMIKAGLIGWLRFLPLGEMVLPEWGTVFLIAGLLAAFYGVAIGLTQDNPKTVLAYSSISQMGLITIGLGIGCKVPAVWQTALAAISVYALHHALAKGALFLSVGLSKGLNSGSWQRALILFGILLPALALAGAPYSSGAVAKLALKEVVISAPEPWPALLNWLLPTAAFGTTLLMGRFLFLACRPIRKKATRLAPGLWLSWYALLICVAIIPWLFAPGQVVYKAGGKPSLNALVPVIAGTVVAWGFWRERLRLRRMAALTIPAGDILFLLQWLMERISQWHKTVIHVRFLKRFAYWRTLSWHGPGESFIGAKTSPPAEKGDNRWITAGFMFALLIVTLFVLLAYSGR